MIAYPFTAVPNWFFQIAPELGEAELRIMLQVWFDTAGRQKDFNTLAYSYISDSTGITNTTSISKALKSLEKRGLITRQASRLAGQRITVTPATLPADLPEVLTYGESTTHLKSVRTHLKRVDYSPKVSHNKNQPESMNLESTTDSAGDLESIENEKAITLLLLSYGIGSATISKLILILRENERDISYIQECWGYVCQVKPKKPQGYLVTLISNNAGIQSSQAAQGPVRLIQPPTYHYGGPSDLELVKHNGLRQDCQDCQEGESARNG